MNSRLDVEHGTVPTKALEEAASEDEDEAGEDFLPRLSQSPRSCLQAVKQGGGAAPSDVRFLAM